MNTLIQINSLLLPLNSNQIQNNQKRIKYIIFLFLLFTISIPLYLYYSFTKKISSSSINIISEYIILKNENKYRGENNIKIDLNLKDNITFRDYNLKIKSKNSNFKSFLTPMNFLIKNEEPNLQGKQNQDILMYLINNQFSGLWESLNSVQNKSNYAVGKSNKGFTTIKFSQALEKKSKLDSIALIIQNNEDEYIDHWMKLTSFSNFQNLKKTINITQKTLELSGKFETIIEKGEFLEIKEKETNSCNSIINITFPLIIEEIEEYSEDGLTKLKKNVSYINNDFFTLLINSTCGYKLKVEGKVYNEFEENKKKQKKLKTYFFLSLSSSIIYILGISSLVFGIKKNEMVLSAINIECITQNAGWNFYLCISNIYFAIKTSNNFFWTFVIIGHIYIIKFLVFDIRLFSVFWEIKERYERNNNKLMKLKVRFLIYFYFLIFSSFFVTTIFFTNPLCIIIICLILWIPQILHNIKNNNRYGLPLIYIFACSIDRIIYPLYFRGIKNSFFMLRQNYYTSYAIIIFAVLSVLILLIQIFKGPRFMLSEKYQGISYKLYKTRNELETEITNRDLNNEKCVICLLPIFYDDEKTQKIEMKNLENEDEEIERDNDGAKIPVKVKEELDSINSDIFLKLENDSIKINNINNFCEYEDKDKLNEINDNDKLLIPDNIIGNNNLEKNNNNIINDNIIRKIDDKIIGKKKCSIKKYLKNYINTINNIVIKFYFILKVLLKHNLFCFYKVSITNNDLYIFTPCKHIFHSQCLEKWIEHKKECPNCRSNLETFF